MASCKSAVSVADDAYLRVVRPTYANRYRPESDAEFVMSIAKKVRGGDDGSHESSNVSPHRQPGPGPGPGPGPVVDSYSCRQMYLKSYTFVRKESVQEKTRRYVDKVREKASDLPLLYKRRPSGGGKKAKDVKRCPALMWALVRTLLSCTTSTHEADRSSST